MTVCERWQSSYAAFLEDVGPRPSPSHSLDRYPDNDGNYEPSNVRWATAAAQCRNRRSNVMIEYGGKRMCIKDWAVELGISCNTLRNRLKLLGWSVQKSLTAKVADQNKQPRKP